MRKIKQGLSMKSNEPTIKELVSSSYYFKKIDVLKRLDNLNKVGMNDYDVARTLKMDIRTIKGFRKGQNIQKRSFLKLLNGVIEIKKQLEELGKIV